MLEEISQVLIFPTLIWLPLFLIFMRSWAFLRLHLQLWLQLLWKPAIKHIYALHCCFQTQETVLWRRGARGDLVTSAQMTILRFTSHFWSCHVFGWSLHGYKFPREASCKWVGAHWSVKWHQKTQKWSSIKPPNASQGCLAKKKPSYFLQLIFNVQLTLSKTDTFGTGTSCPY